MTEQSGDYVAFTKGWCRTCEAEVALDGRPISEDESEWSHMRLDVEIGMGHAHGCWGDCGKHGCPVPEPYQVQVECGPVVLSGSSGQANQ